YIDAHADTTLWIIQYPFTLKTHHYTHESVSHAFLRALEYRGYAGKIWFYESFEKEPLKNNFNSERGQEDQPIQSNLILPFDQESMAAKKRLVANYPSQIERDPKYGTIYEDRDRLIAKSEEGTGDQPFAERLLCGRLSRPAVDVMEDHKSVGI